MLLEAFVWLGGESWGCGGVGGALYGLVVSEVLPFFVCERGRVIG